MKVRGQGRSPVPEGLRVYERDRWQRVARGWREAVGLYAAALEDAGVPEDLVAEMRARTFTAELRRHLSGEEDEA